MLVKIKALARSEAPKKAVWNSPAASAASTKVLQLQPLIFELKESYSIQRVCSLLEGALSSKQEHSFMLKLEGAVRRVCQKFIENEFE